MPAGATKALLRTRIGQPIAGIILRIRTERALLGPTRLRKPAFAARLDHRQGDALRQESQLVATAAAESIFEIDHIAAALADEKLQNISFGLIERASHRRTAGIAGSRELNADLATDSQIRLDM